MTLGARLKNLRNEKDYTQSEMVNALNYKYGTKINTAMWSKWENDKETPSLDHLRLISEYFGASLDYLSGLTDQRFYPNSSLKNKSFEDIYSENSEQEIKMDLLRLLRMAKENPDVRVLFSLAENLSAEDLKQLTSFIKMIQKDGD